MRRRRVVHLRLNQTERLLLLAQLRLREMPPASHALKAFNQKMLDISLTVTCFVST